MTKHQRIRCPGFPVGSCSAEVWQYRRMCDDCKARRRSPEIRFWSKVAKGEGCWEWQGTRGQQGYGKFSIRRTVFRSAHRYAWELTHGPIPDGLYVLHHCDNVEAIRNRPRVRGSLSAIAKKLGIGYMRAWYVASGRTYRDDAA